MKLKKHTLIGLVLSLAGLASLSALAEQHGGESGGGGNAFAGSPEEVDSFVAKLPGELFMGMLSEAQVRQFLNPRYVAQADVAALLEKMRGGSPDRPSGVALLEDAMQTRYLTSNVCRHNGIASDASTRLARNADVCFSRSLLARFPKAVMEEEVATLAMHELAHHFGADEAVATKFQNFMRGFVRDFLRMRARLRALPVKPEHVREVRPGGLVYIGEGSARISVICVGGGVNGGEPTHGDPTGNVVALIPGESSLLGAAADLSSVSCKDYPAVDCAILEKDGRPALQVGDIPYWNTAEPAKLLEQLQLAGVCRKK